MKRHTRENASMRTGPAFAPSEAAGIRFALADGTLLEAAVRRSARARRVRLALDPYGRLRLTVPADMPAARIAALARDFLPWLERAWPGRAPDRDILPEEVVLPLPGAAWRVEAGGDLRAGRLAAARPETRAALQQESGGRRLLVVERPGLLRLFGDVADAALGAKALRRWCRQAAERLLPAHVRGLAAAGGFAPGGVAVRDQRARWGSCSAGGCVRLNWRAVLLPVPLLSHLCWHELCHLRHMDHSAAFHAELERHSPLWREKEKALGGAWRSLPWWARPGADQE